MKRETQAAPVKVTTKRRGETASLEDGQRHSALTASAQLYVEAFHSLHEKADKTFSLSFEIMGVRSRGQYLSRKTKTLRIFAGCR